MSLLEYEDAGDDEGEEEGVQNNVENGQNSKQQNTSDNDDDSAFSSASELKNKEELAKILDEERRIPMLNLQVLVATFAVVLAVNLLKGGGAFQSSLGIRCGSRGFWLANGAKVLWILLVSVFARDYLVRRHEIKERCG